MEFAEHWLAKSHGTTFYDAIHNASNGVTVGQRGFYFVFHARGKLCIRAANGILLHIFRGKPTIFPFHAHRTYTRGVCSDFYPRLFQGKLGKSTGNDTRYGFTRTLSATAAIISKAIFFLIREIGVRRTENIFQFRIIF